MESRLAAAFMACLLMACGGGGGGAPANTENGSGNGAGGTTGLVPPAPAVGVTLYTNAADLRPLIDGARWQYRGVRKAADGSTLTNYTSSVSQSSASGAVQETESDVFLDGDETMAIALSAGSVIVQARYPLGVGSNDVVAMTQLRSPVRVNDQYTHYEHSDVPTGMDFDGDGRADLADVAIYSRVHGNESVGLTELSRTVTALKVETTVLVRVKNSSNGVARPVTSQVQNQWYVAGVGVVRRSRSAVATSGPGPLAYDELLFSWDGVTEGLGSLGPTAARLPGSFSLLPGILAATTLGDQALVLTGSLQANNPGALTFGVFDKRGFLQSTRQEAGLGDSLDAFASPSLFGIDGNTALLAMPLSTGPGTLKLQRVDASGTLQGSSSTVNVLTSGNLQKAWDGQALWLSWLSTGSQVSDQGTLMLQPFDADGLPLASAQVLDTPTMGGQISGVGLSAAGGRLLVSWTHTEFNTVSYRYAVALGSSGVADVRTLDTMTGIGSPRVVVPVMGSGVAALHWNGPVFTSVINGPLPETLPRGVTLDAAWNPRRGSVGNLDNELLPASWVGANTPVLTRAIGDRLVVSSFIYQVASPQLGLTRDFILTSFVQPGSSPFATAAASASAMSLSSVSGSLTNIDEFGLPTAVLLWDDRALVIGNNSGRTMTSLFWLR